jgi:hypothetical protein
LLFILIKEGNPTTWHSVDKCGSNYAKCNMLDKDRYIDDTIYIWSIKKVKLIERMMGEDYGQSAQTFICKVNSFWKSDMQHWAIVNNAILYTWTLL